jgi:hypothetical protein
MSHSTGLTLRVHVPGADSYELGDEIWQLGIVEAIAEEAEKVAETAGAELLEEPTEACREQLRRRVIDGMTDALVDAGDTYTAPDGVRYSLVAGSTIDSDPRS